MFYLTMHSGTDLGVGSSKISGHPLKFKNCPFYLGFLGFFTNLFSFFILLWCPFYLGTPPPPPPLHTYTHQKSWIRPRHSTFYLRLYGVRHIVKNHSNSERGKLHGLLFPIMREKTRRHHYTNYSSSLGTMDVLYVISHRQNST